jgi:hypothetical protein
MPEIFECFTNLCELLRFIPLENNDTDREIQEYEHKTLNDMAQNRIKLFGQYGYC